MTGEGRRPQAEHVRYDMSRPLVRQRVAVCNKMPPVALMKLEPAQRVGDQAFDAIHDAIMTGEYRAGQRLQIRQLAEKLGTSVMPVREAIKRLEELSLVETFPHRSAVVKRFTRDELLQLYAVRRILEVEATRLGAPAVPTKDIQALRKLHSRLASALARGNAIEYLEFDEKLLASVYLCSGNTVLLDTIRRLWQRCRSYKIVGVRRQIESGQTDILLSYQEELINAVAAGDVDRAEQITADSLDAATERIRAALPDEGAD